MKGQTTNPAAKQPLIPYQIILGIEGDPFMGRYCCAANGFSFSIMFRVGPSSFGSFSVDTEKEQLASWLQEVDVLII